MSNLQMRTRSMAVLVVAIAFLMIAPITFTFVGEPMLVQSQVLAPDSTPYSENISVYLTSGEVLWQMGFSGGNISISSISIPPSVSQFSLALASFSNWKPQFEIFSGYGFGLLGRNDPYPDAAMLVINSSSSADAGTLADALSLRFGLDFVPLSSSPNGFVYYSPIDFNTELHVYFWNLIPSYYGGFASMMTEQQFESSGDLRYFDVSYSSSNSSYFISIANITPLSSTTFKLYQQLGLTQNTYNYSTFAQNSKIQVHVLGGLISKASTNFTNYFSNFTSYMQTSKIVGGNSTVPNLNATVNLSFPTIVAYRQVSPTLTPSKDANVSVTIFVKDVSPPGIPGASNVSVNDTWIYSQSSNFDLTVRQTGAKQNLSSGQTMTVAYAFTVLASNGTFSIPATPVSYQFLSGNQTVTSQVFLNPETLIIGAQNSPQLEATATLSGAAIQAGQAFSVNVSVTNKGSGTALNVNVAGQSKQNLPAGSTWSIVTNTSSYSLTQTNSTVAYPVSWNDASGSSHSTKTNLISAVFSFGSPGTPGVSISKTVAVAASLRSAIVTLFLNNTSPNVGSSFSIVDTIPNGFVFGKSYNGSDLSYSNGVVIGNASALVNKANLTLIYSVNITNPNENYVVLPASVDMTWNNITISHYSNGAGLPLGVVSIKQISPAQEFQNSNVSISISVLNNGTLPIYNVSLNNTVDPFMKVYSANSTFKQVLSQGQSMSTVLVANLNGAPGKYTTNPAAATFMFAGSNQTAFGKSFSVEIYRLVEANLTYSAAKVEESHDINVNVIVTNPANVSVSNVSYAVSLPPGLRVVQGRENFTIPTLSSGQSFTNSFTIITSIPFNYTIDGGTLTFGYQGHTLTGNTNTLVINIVDDINTRYGIPIVIGMVIALATLLYVRRISKK